MAKCKGCGKSFNEDKAAVKFNDYFEDEYDYDYNGWEGYCADCAISGQEDCDDDDDYDEDNPPPGCRECGGPYPSCISSCSIYDD